MTDLHLALFHALNLGPQSPAALLGLARLSSTALPLAGLAAMAGAFVLRDAALRRTLVVALLAIALAWLVARGLSALWPTPRPFVLGLGHQGLAHKPTPSFPSSHASVAFAAGFALWLRLRHPVWRWLPPGLALLVAWSRVALGLHFPLDVLAGAVVGCLSAWLACRALSLRGGAWVAPPRRLRP